MKKLRKADFLVICIAVIVLLVCVVFPQGGKSASVYVDGVLYKKIPLDENSAITVKSDYGENTVAVKDGKVYVESSDCKNALCQKNSISKAGQSIVCLPNRLSIIIEGNNKEREADILL